MKTKSNQSGSAPESGAFSMRRIFQKKTDVNNVKHSVLDLLSEFAEGSKKIDMSVHQGEGEMVYVMINKGVVLTLHIQELENATVINGGK